ncbi:Minor extracellular protease vpr [Colletotrichum tanaceti]|uniref:Minor extracellular protease vpr n=1 Tax=Colletotrichum tanaceti TaxID=1306861 RepID=A0A4U6X169_9PEZI|nr:Minor extracellular protease vpr [Colletotrichum tanaceti]TKW49080.1 Minor extracellular protease vpr [Colletotrichum tanaceti]
MRISAAVLVVIALHLGVAAALRLPKEQSSNDPSGPIVPRSFIIEYAPDSRPLVRRHMDTEEGDIKTIKEFESPVFSGAVVETDSSTIETLRELPGVVNIWEDREIKLDDRVMKPRSITRRDDPSFNPVHHSATGVDLLHRDGILGKGVKIGVIDSGIWSPHAALNVAHAYDFVEGSDLDKMSPHGTQIAGIIAATLYDYRVFNSQSTTRNSILIQALLAAEQDGVDIVNYSGGAIYGWDDEPSAVVASRLVDKGIVVIAAAGNNGLDGPFRTYDVAAARGVISVASAESAFLPAFPFQVTFGSGETVNLAYLPGRGPGTRQEPPSGLISWPIVALDNSANHPADGCEPYPLGSPNLNYKIPLVRSGGCTFIEKQQHLNALGAKFILFYNDNDTPLGYPQTSNAVSQIGMIDAKQAVRIMKAIRDNIPVTADFSVNPARMFENELNKPIVNRPSAFSSWGMTFDNQLKPDIAAPGDSIFTTDIENRYTVVEGTSASASYITGVAALYISRYGGRATHGSNFAHTLACRIISSGRALHWSDFDGTAEDYKTATGHRHLAPPIQVGNGLVDAWKVLYSDTQLEFKNIELNDTRYFSALHSITVINNGKSDISYTIVNRPSAGINALSWVKDKHEHGTWSWRVSKLNQLYPKTYATKVYVLEQDPSFTLKSGERKTIEFEFENPYVIGLGWNTPALPVYGGRITIKGSNDEELSVPYAGVGADVRNTIRRVSEVGWPRSTSGIEKTPIRRKASYSFDLRTAVADFPKLFDKRIWGTREVRWDIFDAGWNEAQWAYPPVEGQNGYVGSVAVYDDESIERTFVDGKNDPDDTFSFPLFKQSRHVPGYMAEFWWFGKLANGSKIQPGKYLMRYANLRPFGDPTQSDHWDFTSWEIVVTGQYWS